MNNTVRGIDLGNYFINTSEGVIIPATLEPKHVKANDTDIKAVYDGQAYTVGAENGALNIGPNKYFKNHFKVCLLTAIAKSFDENKSFINTKIVLGVPLEHYNGDFKDKVKQHIKSWGKQIIEVDGKQKEIMIQDIEIFLESAIVFKDKARFKDARTLVIDIGGSTADISEWNGLKLGEFKTYTNGLISLQSKIISTVNEREGTRLRPAIASEMIGKNEFIIKTEKKDISYINQQIENYMLGLISYINQNFDVDSYHSIQLVGGGSIVLEKWLKEEFPHAELFPEAAFANAKTYKSIGDIIWA